MEIYVKFLGKPEIYINKKKVEIQQKKIQVLFLYLLFNESCTRDELSSMFWCDYTESNSRRSLRNSIYKLKNILGSDIIITKGNTIIQINSEYSIKKDIDIFITENNEEKILQLQDTVFLDKIYINNCIEFEKWALSIKNIYEKMFIDKLQNGLKNSVKINSVKFIEKYSIKITSIDRYNEEAYKYLIKNYISKGAYNDAIKLYNELEITLKNDLGIEPEPETKELHNKAVNMKQVKRNISYKSDMYYGHIVHLSTMQEEYRKFLNNGKYYHCMLSGDFGLGKSKLIYKFIQDEKIKDFVEVKFIKPNSNLEYYSIEKIIDTLIKRYNINTSKYIEDFKIRNNFAYVKLLEFILNNLEKSGKKIVLYLENIESIDNDSLNIIFSSLLDVNTNTIFIITEYCQNFRTDYSIISKIELISNIKICKMEPLDLDKTYEFLSTSIGENEDVNKFIDIIYEYTKGNLMFLKDVVCNIHENDKLSYEPSRDSIKKIKRLFASFDSYEYECIELLSIFENGIEIGLLNYVMDGTVITTLNIVEKLYKRHLIEELKIENHNVIKIKIRIIRDLIYDSISNFKKIELHEFVARKYEERYIKNEKDYFYLSELKYNFNFTNSQYEKLYYNILSLKYALDYCDQFFPTIKSDGSFNLLLYINKEDVYKEFDYFNIQLSLIQDSLPKEKLWELEMLLNFLIGRTLNRDGKREKGIDYIKKLLYMAQNVNREDFLLKGYLEAIYYGIKTEDKYLMIEYIEKCKKIESIDKYDVERGIILRLESLCNISDKKYDEAEKLLFKSIDLFESPKLKSSNYINVAAAYDYLGVIYREQKKYDTAGQYFRKAINICLDKNVKKSLDLFYEDLGYNLFLQSRYEEAEECFKKSSAIYDMFGTYWLRSIAESCMAMISVYRGDNDKAIEYFRRAEIYSKKDMIKEELIILDTAKSELKAHKVL